MFEERIAELNNSIATAALAGGNDGKRTYTVEEIQNILEIGKATAYRLIKRGQFKYVKIGGCIRISKKSFDEWLDGQVGQA
jgi:excisionase family DNA binding protein